MFTTNTKPGNYIDKNVQKLIRDAYERGRFDPNPESDFNYLTNGGSSNYTEGQLFVTGQELQQLHNGELFGNQLVYIFGNTTGDSTRSTTIRLLQSRTILNTPPCDDSFGLVSIIVFNPDYTGVCWYFDWSTKEIMPAEFELIVGSSGVPQGVTFYTNDSSQESWHIVRMYPRLTA